MAGQELDHRLHTPGGVERRTAIGGCHPQVDAKFHGQFRRFQRAGLALAPVESDPRPGRRPFPERPSEPW